MSSPRRFGVIPVSCFYRSGRATTLGRAFSRFWAMWAFLGLPPHRQVGLEVKGRRTGLPYTLAVVVAKHEGQLYLVSMLGECEWVKNVRAQREAYVISGRRRKARFEEVPVEGRAPIIQGVHPSRARGTAAHRARYEGDHSRLPAGGSEAPCLPDLVSEYVGPEPLEPMRS